MEQEKKYFASWWFWCVGLVFVTSIIFFGLRLAGVIGERVVFEQSHQYQESRKSEIATYTAQLTEIERKLLGQLDENVRINLEAQASAIRIQLQVARSK